MRKKYATWALGASLAFGGLGIPMKMIQNAESTGKATSVNTAPAPQQPQSPVIQGDLQQAQNIAQRVAGGVTTGMQAVTSGIQQAATAPVQAIEQAPEKMAVITDGIKQQFFAKEVPFGSVIYTEAKKNNIPPELVAAVVNTESKFNPAARSRVGALGLMQLVPRTGRWMGASNLLDPVQNIQAGAKYLKYLSDQFNGDQQKVVAAYNAGPGNVQRFNGVPPFRETRNYVARVNNYRQDLGDRLSTQLDATAGQAAGE
jgi:soluble lytic murein transglycosylase-like protein